MKAILEIEMPESCRKCRLSTQTFSAVRCLAINYDVIKYLHTRHPKCPLKIVPSCAEADKTSDGKCAGYQKSDIDDEPADMCMECKQNEFYEGGCE